MPGPAYDPFKVYNYGDPELAQRTGIDSITGQVQDYASIKAQYAGSAGFVDPEFPHSNRSIGKAGVDSANEAAVLNTKPVIWLRPQDAFKNYYVAVAGRYIHPEENYTTKFSCGGKLSRFDVDQGGIGNCFFVASVGAITMNDKLIEWFCPSDNYDDQGAGVYHFRFWRNGAFVDIVVDDYLPFIVNDSRGKLIQPYAAQLSAVGLTVEFWVQLAEKAYAKLDGGYGQQASGGFALRALQEVTGGMAEHYNFKNNPDYPADLHAKLEEALKKEYSIIALSCKSDQYNLNLKFPHAYVVTKAAIVKQSVGYRTRDVKLLRIYNPHGTNESVGRWSDKDTASWDTVSDEEKARIGVEDKDDGEFWMAYQDVLMCFNGISIISPITIYKEKFTQPPSVYVGYDGTFGAAQGDSYTISAAAPNLDPNGDAIIAADLTVKLTSPEDQLLRYMQLNLYPAKSVEQTYPPELESEVQRGRATYKGAPFGFNYKGVDYKFNYPPEPIPQVEGVKDVQTKSGVSVAAAWKVPPGEYKVNAACPGEDHGYALRILYFKGG